MKKTVISLAMSIIIVGMAALPASAKEVEKVSPLDSVPLDLDDAINLSIFNLIDIDKTNHATNHSGRTLELTVWDDEKIAGLFLEEKSEKRVEQTKSLQTEITKKKLTNRPKQPSQSKSNTKQESRQLTVTATAYTAECTGCSGITATGINLNNDRNKKVIAVDPNVIPLGSKVYVEGYGQAIAGDTGGAIKGNKIDIHVPTKEQAYQWGVRTVQVKILS